MAFSCCAASRWWTINEKAKSVCSFLCDSRLKIVRCHARELSSSRCAHMAIRALGAQSARTLHGLGKKLRN